MCGVETMSLTVGNVDPFIYLSSLQLISSVATLMCKIIMVVYYFYGILLNFIVIIVDKINILCCPIVCDVLIVRQRCVSFSEF